MTGKRQWLESVGAALVLAAGMALVLPAKAALAQPVVQSVPGSGASSLNAALSRLARNPRDVDALVAAGDAALGLGDNGAAAGFFARADALAPNNGAVLAGLAAAKVRAGDPFAAIPLFDTAEKAGAIAPERLADRGLAYDLVGDNTRAQTWYRQAMAGGASDEAARRLGLSQAIAGDRRGAEATLSPLLQKNDRAAWRARAFSLAILGREDEAVSIAQSTMPAPLAQAIAPYLRYMRQLTPAQQAGAANLGRFPRAAEIGHDDPRVAAFAPRTRLAANDAGLVPAGKPLGADGAAAAPPPAKGANLQDQFLNLLRKNKIPVTMFLVKGVKLQGIVTWFDNFSILLRRDGQSQLVYKHAISPIMPSQPLDARQFSSAVEGGKKTRLLQDVFLASTRAAGVQVTMFLVNGVMLQGQIAAYDLFCMLLEREGYVQLAYKHAVSTIQPLGPVDLTGDWDGEAD